MFDIYSRIFWYIVFILVCTIGIIIIKGLPEEQYQKTIDVPIPSKYLPTKISDLEQKIQFLIFNQKINKLNVQTLFKKHNNMRFKNLTVTAYNPTKEQTDSTPMITSSNKRVKPGMVAVSRDLFYEYGWTYGKKIEIEGWGIFEIQDKMGEGIERGIDIMMFDKDKAKEFGRQELRVVLLDGWK